MIQLNRLDLEKRYLNMILKEIITLKNQKNVYVVENEKGVFVPQSEYIQFQLNVEEENA